MSDEASRSMGVRELRGNLTQVLREVRLGQSFLITLRDQVVAEIRPPSKAGAPRRQPGALHGKIWMAPDFDKLPSDVLAVMGSGEV